MSKKCWLKLKKAGRDFFLMALKGWLATFFFVVLIILSAYSNNFFDCQKTISTKEGIRYLLDLIVFAGLAILFLKGKTKKKPNEN